MKATVITRTEKQVETGQETENFIDYIIFNLTNFDYKNIFGNLIGQNQNNQRSIIKNFQKQLQNRLNESYDINDQTKWEIEVLANSEYRDSFDLYIEIRLDNFNYKVIIELDKNRADQIAKKYLSRTSHTINSPTIYFAFCYPGTDKMSLAETKKYFRYCLNISDKLSDNKIPKKFIGLVIE